MARISAVSGSWDGIVRTAKGLVAVLVVWNTVRQRRYELRGAELAQVLKKAFKISKICLAVCHATSS